MNPKQKIFASRVAFFLVIAVFVAAVIIAYTVFFKDSNFVAGLEAPMNAETAAENMPSQNLSEPDYSYDVLSLTFGGTVNMGSMLGSSSTGTFNSFYSQKGAEYFFTDIKDIVEKDDFTFVGLNNVVSDSRVLTTVQKDDREWYRSAVSQLELLKTGSIDAVSVEPSHTKDYGEDGYRDTIRSVTEAGIGYTDVSGAYYTMLSDTVRLVVYSFTWGELTDAEVKAWIAEAKSDTDVVALYIIDSGEGHEVERKKIRSFRGYVDAGADLVIGTNESAIQRAEYYGDGYIVYSLGALIDGSSKYPLGYTSLCRVNLKLRNGFVIEITAETLPLYTYTEEYPWKPTFIKDQEELSVIESFIDNEITTPHPGRDRV